MARNLRLNLAYDDETDSDQEVWSAIRYLDPDRELKKSDIAWGIALIAAFILVSVVIYLHHH
jgi:hypothetical protein